METVFATFRNLEASHKAVGALRDHGVDEEAITVLTQEELGSHVKLTDQTDEVSGGVSTTTGADAAAGARKGAGIGAGLGALGALASLFIPGFGFVFGSGALATAAATLLGTAVAGGAAGGVAGFLSDQGAPQHVATKAAKELEEGRTIMAVHVGETGLSYGEIRAILHKYDALEVSDRQGASV